MKLLFALVLAVAAAGAGAELGAAPAGDAAATFESLALALGSAGFREKEALVERLAGVADPRVPALLEALLAGELYRDAATGALFVGADAPAPLVGATAAGAPQGRLRKVVTNNSLRSALRPLLAVTRLRDPDPGVRAEAARTLTGAAAPTLVPILEQVTAAEQHPQVRRALRTALASVQLADPDPGVRSAAVRVLAEHSDKAILTLLQQRAAEEPDPEVGAVLAEAVRSLQAREQWFAFLGDLFFGLSLGSVLLLAAVGLAITFGVMGVINMAHGEMIMLGAYTTYVVQLLMPDHIELSLAVAVPAAFLVSGLVGIAIERGVIRFLYGRPLETLLATFGISLILQQLVRSIFSPLNKSVVTPQWLSGSWEINGMLSLTYNRLYIVLFALGMLVSLVALLRRTPIGLQMRAVTQNRAMASSMGIRTGRVDALTFGLGSGIAGIAGVALSQLTNVGPNLGQSYIIDSFLVVVFGGVGNLLGTFVAAMGLGVVTKFAEPLAGAVLAKILILIFVILFIQRRPRGLFALKGRFVED
jgi:urea transport system permease protein